MARVGNQFYQATGYTKVKNVASNLSSLAFFALNVELLLSREGRFSHGHPRGAKFIRPIFLTIVIAMMVKLIYDAYWK